MPSAWQLIMRASIPATAVCMPAAHRTEKVEKPDLIHDLLVLYLYYRDGSELTSHNPLSHSRLACSRMSGHIEPHSPRLPSVK